MFKCQECGRKFRTTKAAERAALNGCPGCNGVDIDLDPEAPVIPVVAKRTKPVSNPIGRLLQEYYFGDSGPDPLRPECSDDPKTGMIYTCSSLSCPIHGQRNREVQS